MGGLQETIARLTTQKLRYAAFPSPAGSDRLSELFNFGSNPGQLKAKIYMPPLLRSSAPLVVVLHGCTQSAASYDIGSGWSRLAEEQGFAVLFPEQQRSNNPNLCFNWFSPTDTSRERGEALSIRQMIGAIQQRHSTDPSQTFVTGLSAGAAMSAAMLATYPDVFAGGAVIAGLPFGTARSVPEAFDQMRAHVCDHADGLAALVRAASTHRGPWPTLSVWHGSGDKVVDPSNASALIDQWGRLHGTEPAPSRIDEVHGYPHRVWSAPDGREVIEEYVITGMGHGTPLSAEGGLSYEVPGPYMLEAGISSTRLIASFWGINDQAEHSPLTRLVELAPEPVQRLARVDPPLAVRAATRPSRVSNVQATIERALRSAGLMH
ncbi:PHB depolymerase family esterase [Sphingomonas ginkgonis]|uniref:PHB depolymerase family esterase n=1 Tax=Sphingomonas ginkgonis TaxID=2315330 RepID=A0A3R9YMR4_9SPHN|nr:PHB depolymerase family esterase [Sphingomonas ginkgonis]RST31291.1 PHB depolymerase family esterase [Sphingomonas ginkgonis]